MNRLTRHIVTEILELFLAILLGLVVVIMSFRFAALLSEAASGKIVGSAIFKLLGLFAVGATEYLIPFAFFIAIVAVLVNLSSTGEYVAMRALGFGQARLQRTLLLASLPIAALMLFMSFRIYPQALDLSFKMLDQAREEGETSLIKPGQFRSVGQNTMLFVAEHDTPNNTSDPKAQSRSGFKRFFLYQIDGTSETITTANAGMITAKTDNENQRKRVLTLQDGARTTVFFTGKNREQALWAHFDELDFYLPDINIQSRRNQIKTQSMRTLFADTRPRAQAEIQRRIASALSIPAFALLAWLLVSDKPRTTQYMAFTFAILVYLIYTVNQTVVVGLVEKGSLPLLPGGYLIPLLTLAVTLFAIRWQKR